MKVRVNIPLKESIEYYDDFIEESIPDAGERFNDEYVVYSKAIDGNMCVLNLRRE